MTLEFKDKDQLVSDVITSISSKIADIDFSDGEPLKTIIEAIMQEMDNQYWQLKQLYDNSFLDTAYGDDLTNLVKLMGVNRLSAVNATGRVKFYRATAAVLDYFIPEGTIVETLPDSEGKTYSYATTENVTLATGQLSVYANISAVVPGTDSNVVTNKIVIINNPPLGIESVTNDEVIIGGEDGETDESLRARASDALEASGQGTINAITNKVSSTPGVKTVNVIDMNRGIGTIDILVLGDEIPMPQSKKDEISAVVNSCKAGGIDFQIIEPTSISQNITITLTLASGADSVTMIAATNTAITNYFNTLGIGDSFIKNQLIKDILDSNVNIIDVNMTTPTNNVTAGSTSIITLGTVTIS